MPERPAGRKEKSKFNEKHQNPWLSGGKNTKKAPSSAGLCGGPKTEPNHSSRPGGGATPGWGKKFCLGDNQKNALVVFFFCGSPFSGALTFPK